MALIFENSVCPFCELLLNDGSETGALPALFNTEHKYGICSDSGYHIECFENWEHSEAVNLIYEEYLALTKQKPEIPDGMSFDKFEKTEAYKEYVSKENALLGLKQ